MLNNNPMKVLKESIEAGMREVDALAKNNKLNEALLKTDALVKDYDMYYGITRVNKNSRAAIKEDDAKLLMLDAHLKYFEFKFMVNQLNLNTLDLNVLESSIDVPVDILEKELKTYKFTNKLNLLFKQYISYETCRRSLVQLGAKTSLRRMTFHKMRTLTKLRFAQTLYQPALNIIERIKALVLTVMLVIFWATSDFGQNIVKYIVSIFMLLVSFGLFYGTVSSFDSNVLQLVFGSKIMYGMYVSLVTFFTLGAYNVLPADLLTSVVMSVQYIAGYFYLGLFVAILIDRVIN